MSNYHTPITEENIRKYASSDIVHALDESINAYIQTNLQQHQWMMGEQPTEEEYKAIVENSHAQALWWLQKHYYTEYCGPETPEQQQMQVNLERLDLAYSLDKLAGEPVTEIEMVKI